jgi:hypothetical protein
VSAETSSARARALALAGQARGLVESLVGREPLLPGSLYTLRRRCGKPGCRCTRGQLHATPMLSYRGQGKPQNVTPRPGEVAALRALTEAYQRFRRGRREWVRLVREMRAELERLEGLRVEEGERRFRALLARRGRRGSAGQASPGQEGR